MEYYLLIDWLRYTVPDIATIKQFTTKYALTTSIEKPHGYYNAALALMGPQGERVGGVEWDTENASQRVCFTFTGKDLDYWRKTEIGVMALFAFAINADANFTRIDAALDIKGDKRATVLSIIDSIRREETHLKGKTHSIIESTTQNGIGRTLYIGSRSSDKYIRVYDKAAEQGLVGIDWIRVELEAKGKYARALGYRMLQDGISIAIPELQRAIDCPLVWWLEAIAAPDTEKVRVDRTPGNRIKWQNEVLIGMVQDALIENSDFLARVRVMIERLASIDAHMKSDIM